MEMDILSSRPSIRIEIQNDIKEAMDVDETDISQTEETLEDGEVSEQEENDKNVEIDKTVKSSAKAADYRYQNKWKNQEGGFLTGIDIFSKEEQDKLSERAKRFGLNPDESKAMTDQQLQELHESLGITKDVEKNVRFDAVHIRGVEEMSTKDVFAYFNAYGPAFIEWINDYSCNAVWQDNISAARALHGLSKRIRGMEFLDEINPFVEESVRTDESNSDTKSNPIIKRQPGRSILLVDESQSSGTEDSQNEMDEFGNAKTEEFINASEIAIPIPPGYWRCGLPHSKAKSILLRFALRTDRKPYRAEKLSDYYKKYGNPNYGNLRGIITESRKRKLKGYVDLDKKLEEEEEAFLNQVIPNSKNPWGYLAKNWNSENTNNINRIQNQHGELDLFDSVVEPKRPTSPIQKSIRDRIGTKRAISIPVEEACDSEDSDNSNSEWTKRSKVPRMRMYADEEQDRMKKLNAVKKLARTEIVNFPVRSKYEDPSHGLMQFDDLESTNIRLRIKQEPQEKSVTDLRSRLGRHIVLSSTSSDTMNSREDEHSNNRQRLQGRLGNRVLAESGRGRESSSMKIDMADHHKTSQRHEFNEIDEQEDIDSLSRMRQRSTVKVVIRKPMKPTVASTVWSRVDQGKETRYTDEIDDDENRNQKNIKRHHETISSRISERENIKPHKSTKMNIAYKKDVKQRFKLSSRSKNTRQNIRTTIIKKEKQTDSSESDSESESEDATSVSEETESNSSEDENKSESPLKKVLSLRDTFNKGTDIKNKLSATKDNLRIEVHNDCYRKEKSE